MENKLTRDEFYKKYGNVEVTFSSYYKYTFVYSATLLDGKRLVVSYGGNHEDIYGHEVGVGSVETANTLQPYSGSVYENGTCVESFDDY